MPMQNPDVAGIFKKVADLVETEVESRFKIEAYRDAARIGVGEHPRTATSARCWRRGPCASSWGWCRGGLRHLRARARRAEPGREPGTYPRARHPRGGGPSDANRWSGGHLPRRESDIGFVLLLTRTPELLAPLRYHRERNTVQHGARRRKETGLEMQHLQALATTCNL